MGFVFMQGRSRPGMRDSTTAPPPLLCKKKKNGHQERQVLRYLTEGTTTYLLMKTEHPDAVHITYLEVS